MEETWRWFGPDDVRSFGHRSRLKGMGYSDRDYLGKPVVGILNTWSELNTCHSHLRERAEDVKRGVWQAGGFPVEVPVVSLGVRPNESNQRQRCGPMHPVVAVVACLRLLAVDRRPPTTLVDSTVEPNSRDKRH